MRLMSWNLLEGACLAASSGSCAPHPQRLAAAQDLVRFLSPDILVINEALWCQEFGGQHVDYAQRFGFPFICAKLYDAHWGNAIVSRFPIVSCQSFDIYNRGGLVAQLSTPHGFVSVATYHPHPSRWPNNKTQDFLAMARLASPEHPLILCGDFNAISPDDRPDRTTLAQAFARFSQDPGAASARFVDAGQAVFPHLIRAGLRDALPVSRRLHSMPTRMLPEDPAGRMRIDHAWVNGRVCVDDAWICQDQRADVASDHYPVIVDFQSISQ